MVLWRGVCNNFLVGVNVNVNVNKHVLCAPTLMVSLRLA